MNRDSQGWGFLFFNKNNFMNNVNKKNLSTLVGIATTIGAALSTLVYATWFVCSHLIKDETERESLIVRVNETKLDLQDLNKKLDDYEKNCLIKKIKDS